MFEQVDQTARKRRESRLFTQLPPSQAGIRSSRVWSKHPRQLIISQLAPIMAQDPGLVLKNPKTESSRFNDAGISAGFTGSGFLPRSLDKSLLPASGGEN